MIHFYCLFFALSSFFLLWIFVNKTMPFISFHLIFSFFLSPSFYPPLLSLNPYLYLYLYISFSLSLFLSLSFSSIFLMCLHQIGFHHRSERSWSGLLSPLTSLSSIPLGGLVRMADESSSLAQPLTSSSVPNSNTNINGAANGHLSSVFSPSSSSSSSSKALHLNSASYIHPSLPPCFPAPLSVSVPLSDPANHSNSNAPVYTSFSEK